MNVNDSLYPKAQPEDINNVHALNYIHEPRSMADNRFECTIQNRGVRCAYAYAWAHNNEYLWCILNFSRQNVLKYYFMFAIDYIELKMIHLRK